MVQGNKSEHMGNLHEMRKVSLNYAMIRKVDRGKLACAKIGKWNSNPCNKILNTEQA